MSRIGAKPIMLPAGISVEFNDGVLLVKNDKLRKELKLCEDIKCRIFNRQLLLSIDQSRSYSNKQKALWGTYRSNINNIINGMINDFSVHLEISGVGYRAEYDNYNKYLTLYLGYSHGVKYKMPKGVEIKHIKSNYLIISSFDKQKVYMVASDLCRIRKYDPYKGKGIIIKNKFVLRKVISKKK